MIIFAREEQHPMGQKERKILKLLLLVLFVFYHVNITLFTHVHYIDGQPVAHSHPYTGHHGNHHNHSCAEFHALQLLSLLILLAGGIFALPAVFRTIHRIRYNRDNRLVYNLFHPTYSLRAPPAC